MNKLTKYACILTALAGAVACSDGKKAQGNYAIIPLPQEVATQGSAPFLLKPSTPPPLRHDLLRGYTSPNRKLCLSYVRRRTSPNSG